MSKINDGGPAFPVAENHRVAYGLPWTCGMSLRAWFAGKADPLPNDADVGYIGRVLGIGECPRGETEGFAWFRKAEALWRLAQADAMIAALEETNGAIQNIPKSNPIEDTLAVNQRIEEDARMKGSGR